MEGRRPAKPVRWIAGSQDDLRSFPEPVKNAVGYALWRAQLGEIHESAKALKGYGDAGVLEVIEDYDRATYRAVYTVRFAERGVRAALLSEEVHTWNQNSAA